MECMLLEEVEVEARVATPIPMSDVWMLHFNKASNAWGSGIGMILIILDGIIAKQAFYFNFKTLNNEAKLKHFWQG